MSYGPPIETLDDWNARLTACGCCPIPFLGPPRYARRIHTCTVRPIGYLDPEGDNLTLYSARTYRQDAAWSRSTPNPGTPGTYYTETSYTGYQEDLSEYPANYYFTCSSCPESEDGEPTETETITGSGSYLFNEYHNWRSYCSATDNEQLGTDNIRTETFTYTYDSGLEEFRKVGEVVERDWYHYACDPHEGPFLSTTPVDVEAAGIIVTPSGGFASGEYTELTTYSEGESYASWLISAEAALRARIEPVAGGCYTAETLLTPQGSTFGIAENSTPDFYGDSPVITIRAIQLRWFMPLTSVPATPYIRFTYIGITWDYAFFPEGGGAAAIVSTDHTAELEVSTPGDPPPNSWNFCSGASCPARTGWWVGDWALIPLPDYPGQVRPVNIRYTCLRTTPWGVPPPIPTGEAVPVP